MLQTLLLNQSYEVISFISLRSLIKLFVKNKIEIESSWDDTITWGAGQIEYPAIVRLKYYIHRPPGIVKFNRKSVFRRDMYTCLYCGKSLSASQCTIDHLIPRSRGGTSNWLNCVTSCSACNRKKGNRTLEESGMKLTYEPYAPKRGLASEYLFIKPKHESWKSFFPEVEQVESNSHVQIYGLYDYKPKV